MIEETNEVKELMIESYILLEKIEKANFILNEKIQNLLKDSLLNTEIKILKQKLLRNSEKISEMREKENRKQRKDRKRKHKKDKK